MKAKSHPYRQTGWRRPQFAEAAKRIAITLSIVVGVILLALLSHAPSP
jgi:hypothetical protein